MKGFSLLSPLNSTFGSISGWRNISTNSSSVWWYQGEEAREAGWKMRGHWPRHLSELRHLTEMADSSSSLHLYLERQLNWPRWCLMLLCTVSWLGFWCEHSQIRPQQAYWIIYTHVNSECFQYSFWEATCLNQWASHPVQFIQPQNIFTDNSVIVRLTAGSENRDRAVKIPG